MHKNTYAFLVEHNVFYPSHSPDGLLRSNALPCLLEEENLLIQLPQCIPYLHWRTLNSSFPLTLLQSTERYENGESYGNTGRFEFEKRNYSLKRKGFGWGADHQAGGTGAF